MAIFCSKQIVVPVTGKMLGDYSEGDIVLLNESGSPIEFYVAKQDYESGLNGAGRTLLVRKDCYGIIAWDSSNVNTYTTSTISTWLNGDYKALLDAGVQSAIGTTKFYYTSGTTVTTLERSVFLLSLTELGGTGEYANVEGSVLPIASTLQFAYLSGSAVAQWTRTPFTGNSNAAYYINYNAVISYANCSSTTAVLSNYCSRPCFTLPGTALFDPDSNQFKGVA